MEVPSLTPVQLSANDFLRGLLAALAAKKQNVLSANQSELHRAFHGVLKKLRSPNFSNALSVDLLDVDYDPLYGLSGWLDRALTSAQLDLLISFPNPSYDRIDIRFGQAEGKRIVEAFGSPEAFLELAESFSRELSGAGTPA